MGGLWRTLRAVSLGVAAVWAGVFMWQDNLLYFPERASQAQMVALGLAAWPSATDFRGLVAEPRGGGGERGTVIVFHGNAGHAAHRRFYADALTPLGLRVILAEYPGYGPRDGALGEDSFVADAVRTIALAQQRHGRPLLVIGESLGAGVAAAAAARERDKPSGLLLITPWDTLSRVAAHHYPWLPVGLLLRDRYDSETHLRGFDRPAVVALAEHDSIVPARFGRALYEALSAPRRLELIPGAEHNDWVEHVDSAWWRRTVDFLLGKAA